jgi:uncharacterized protein YegL
MKNYTDLNIILDRSGSMSTIASDMVGGIKTFLEKEKATGDDTNVSFFQFDDKYDTVFVDKSIKDNIDIPLVPRGGTALLDAIGKTIASVGEKLSNMTEENRPNRVLFFIITDGFENSSQEFTASAVAEKVKHQRDTYAWDFVFLGAGEEAVLAQHTGVGVMRSSSMGFAKDPVSINAAFCSVSESYMSYKNLDRNDTSSRKLSFDLSKKPKAVESETTSSTASV